MTFFQHLSLMWRRFSPLEERLLAAVRRVLPPSAQRAFDAQVRAITHVQRHPDWTEIAFYRKRGGRVDWGDVPLFPRMEELPLAEVRFRARGRAYKARLTAIRGHVFDFQVTPSPRQAAFATWDAEPDARLLSDPGDVGAAPPVETLPEAWRTFLAAGSERVEGDWVLHDESGAYRLAMDDGEFLVLAERHGDDFLLYRLEPEPRGFFVQRGHDGRPRPLMGELSSVLSDPHPPW